MCIGSIGAMIPKRRIIPIFVPHFGCPNACVFCNQRRISGAQVPATVETVRQSIEAAQSILPSNTMAELAFLWREFYSNSSTGARCLAICSFAVFNEGKLSGIRISTRPDAITQPILDRLKRYHVQTIELGAQSMIDSVLWQSGRGHTAQDTVNAVTLIQRNGFHLILQMMTGLPGDCPEGAIETAKRIIALHPDGVRIYPTVILKDTPLFEAWSVGLYIEHTVEDAVELCAKLVPLFEKAKIPVIRLGLNPTEALSKGDAAGGAYHPAFGELVHSRILLERAEEQLRQMHIAVGSKVVLGVHPQQISAMVGQHRCNLMALQKEFDLHSIRVSRADVKMGKILVQKVAKD